MELSLVDDASTSGGGSSPNWRQSKCGHTISAQQDGSNENFDGSHWIKWGALAALALASAVLASKSFSHSQQKAKTHTPLPGNGCIQNRTPSRIERSSFLLKTRASRRRKTRPTNSQPAMVISVERTNKGAGATQFQRAAFLPLPACPACFASTKELCCSTCC